MKTCTLLVLAVALLCISITMGQNCKACGYNCTKCIKEGKDCLWNVCTCPYRRKRSIQSSLSEVEGANTAGSSARVHRRVARKCGGPPSCVACGNWNQSPNCVACLQKGMNCYHNACTCKYQC